jgi:hypothetical protein
VRLGAGREAALGHAEADPEAAGSACLETLSSHDLVFCSRYLDVPARYPPRRRPPSRAYRRLYRALLGVPVQDAMSGLFGLRREVLDAIPPLESDGFEVYLELVVKARRRGLRTLEVSAEFVHRAGWGEFSVLRQGPQQLARALRVWRRFVVGAGSA